MATSLSGLSLSDEKLNEISTTAKEWCRSNVKMGNEDQEASNESYAPFSLFPSVVPSAVTGMAKRIMPHFNRLMHKVAMDHAFLEECLKDVITVDEFMFGMWNIYDAVRSMGLQHSMITQPMMLGVFRNDFVLCCKKQAEATDELDPDNVQLKQVGFNSIASGSFAGLAQKIGDLHRLTLGLAGKQFTEDQTPSNLPVSGLASGLAKAWELYGNRDAVILFIVSPSEKNALDQRALECAVCEKIPKIRVVRKTLMDLERASVDQGFNLSLDGDVVSVVYLWDGCTMDSYTSEKEMQGRMTMEMSRVIKCPSIQYQLAGSKEIQQELAKPGVLEKFVDDANIVKELRATFACQHSLDLGPEGDKAVALGIASPDKFVLKPKKKGDNLHGADMVKFLTEHTDSEERNDYILMERVVPLQQQNYLVKEDAPVSLSTVVSELGIYGVYIGTIDEEIENQECGYMLRTKVSATDEGGREAEFADTPLIL